MTGPAAGPPARGLRVAETTPTEEPLRAVEPAAADWVSSTCTLPVAEQPLRTAEFDHVFRTALRAVEQPDSTRLVLTLASAPGRADTVRDLVDRESQCCSFFTFTLTELPSAVRLEVEVPPVHAAVLAALATRATHLVRTGS